MSYREQTLGPVLRFLLPSLKLKQPGHTGHTVEQDVHHFLVTTFGGYTATVGNLFGYWKDERGQDSYGEHREFTVALPPGHSIDQVKDFLGSLAARIGEESIYLEVAGTATLIYRNRPPQ